MKTANIIGRCLCPIFLHEIIKDLINNEVPNLESNLDSLAKPCNLQKGISDDAFVQTLGVIILIYGMIS